MSQPPNGIPTYVSQAMITIMQFALSNDLEVERGIFIRWSDAAVAGVEFGDWRLDLRRTRKP